MSVVVHGRHEPRARPRRLTWSVVTSWRRRLHFRAGMGVRRATRGRFGRHVPRDDDRTAGGRCANEGWAVTGAAQEEVEITEADHAAARAQIRASSRGTLP